MVVNTKRILGGAFLAAPFVGIGVMIVKETGWVMLFQAYGGAALIIGCVVAGVFLLYES